MARIPSRFNVNVTISDAVTDFAGDHGLSRSEVVNQAVGLAATNFHEAIRHRIMSEPIETGAKPASYMLDPPNILWLHDAAERIGIAKDAILRIALDYYLHEQSPSGHR